METLERVNADLLLSTPLTVVARGRLEFMAADGLSREQELALVIPRSRCDGDRPLWPALMSAAKRRSSKPMPASSALARWLRT